MEIAGVLVFAYLDSSAGAVRVSIHCDAADDRVVRSDGTVPLHVGVGDTVVFDDSTSEDVLTELLWVADDHQEAVIRRVALAAGLLWSCETCGWSNPRAADRCDGPGPCNQPKPARTSHC